MLSSEPAPSSRRPRASARARPRADQSTLPRAWQPARPKRTFLNGSEEDISSTDHAEVRDQLQRCPEVSVLAVDWQPDRLIAASDVVITKGTRKTLYQVAALGAPSISISAGLNWPDEVIAAHIPSNTLVSREALSPERLAEFMVEKISQGWLAEASLPQWRGMTAAAEVIIAPVDALREGLHGRGVSSAEPRDGLRSW